MSTKTAEKKKRKRELALAQNLQNETESAVDASPIIHQNDKLSSPLIIRKHPALTEKQKKFIELAMNKDTKMIICSGPAGTAKTFVSILSCLYLLNQQKISDLIYVRSVVESADTKMGFLPGEKEDKLSPYIQPLIDKLDEFLCSGDIDRLQKESRIDGIPIGYLRGLNWNAKGIVADECQNMTKKELITLMTRVGEFSKLFILGDPMQSDIGNKSGFKEIYDIFNDEESKAEGIYTFEFTEDDIVRSKLVKFIAKKLKKQI